MYLLYCFVYSIEDSIFIANYNNAAADKFFFQVNRLIPLILISSPCTCPQKQ